MGTEKKEENILMTINVKNKENESVIIKVHDNYRAELEQIKFPRLMLTECGEGVLIRVNTIQEVAGIIESGEIWALHSSSESYQIYTEEYWDEETDEYREMSSEEVVNEVLKEFKNNGCVYRYVACDGEYIGSLKLFVAPKGSRFIDGECGEVFTAKYKVGTNCFYHAKSSEDLKASKIDSVVVEHKCGYNPTTKYVMKDGASVQESNVLMKDKALEWVNSRG